MNVCRLCSGSEQLTNMFDSRLNNSEQLRFFILLATGLNIREDDIVSKMVCHRCCGIAVKLHKYRTNAVANDKILKEQCGQTYIPPVTDQDELRRLSTQILTSTGKILAPSYGATDGRLLLIDPKNTDCEVLRVLNDIKSEPVDSVPVPKPEPYKHVSVKKVLKKYPGIILPESIYKCDIGPVVTLDESEVEEWAEEEFIRVQQKLSLAKIIIKKVGDTNKNIGDTNKNVGDTNKNVGDTNKHVGDTNKDVKSIPAKSQLNDTLLTKKRPGPKSKTTDVIENKLPPSVHIVKRPGPKSKTEDITPNTASHTFVVREKVVHDANIRPLPQPVSSEVVTPIIYRPGPKSRKSDLVVNAGTPKFIVHESTHKKVVESLKGINTHSTLTKMLEKPAYNIGEELKAASNGQQTLKAVSGKTVSKIGQDVKVASYSKQESKLATSSNSIDKININKAVVNGAESEDDGDDVDFDRDNALWNETDNSYNSSDETEHSTSKSHSSIRRSARGNRISNSKRGKHQSRTRKMVSEKNSQEVATDAFSNSETDKCELTKEQRSFGSKRRVSAGGSISSEEPVKRHRIDSKTENENIVSKTRNSKVDSSHKEEQSDVKIPKPNVSKNKSRNELRKRTDKQDELVDSDNKAADNNKTSVGKDELSKKKVKLSSNEKKESNKAIITDKKESPGLAKDQPELPNTSGNEKKIVFSTSVSPKIKDIPSNLVMGKTQKIYMCHICCNLFDTNKELHEHQKMHLICKYCNYRMKNMETLKKHQEENCHMNVDRVQAQPTLKLTKVDEIQSIVSKYPDAFDENTNAEDIANLKDHDDQIVNSQQVQPASAPQPITPTIKTEVLCISDESDDEVQYVGHSKEESLLPKSFLDLPLSGLTEGDMIQSLFNKHLKAGVLQLQRASQTFIPQATNIKYTNSNLIVLENLFDQLYTYKIPIQLEIKPKISARFTGEIKPPLKSSLECWAHVKAITVRKPSYKTAHVSSKPVWIAPAKLQSSSPIRQSGVQPNTITVPSAPVIVKSSSSSVLQTTQALVFPSTSSTALVHTSKSTKPPTVSSTAQAMVLPSSPSSKSSMSSLQGIVKPTASASKSTTPTSLSSPTQAVVVSSSLPQLNTNTIILNNLLHTSPAVPTSSHLLPNSSLFLTATNSFLPSVNSPDKNPPALVSLLSTCASETNRTTTFVQTSNNATLFMQNGIPSGSTTIIQTPNNATLIQTPNAAVIQTGNSTALITPDSASGMTESSLIATNGPNTINSVGASNSLQNSVLLVQTVPQVSNARIINEPASNSTLTSNNVVFQSPSQQILQLNSSGSNVNKVVVLSNTLTNGLQQNMPLYAAPYLTSVQPTSVSIKEIEDNSQTNSTLSSNETSQNKTTITIKPKWELY